MLLWIEPLTYEVIPEVMQADPFIFPTAQPIGFFYDILSKPELTQFFLFRSLGPVVEYKNAPIPPPAKKSLQSIVKRQSTIAVIEPSPYPVVGYAGVSMIEDECHIITGGMIPSYQRKGMGELGLVGLMDIGIVLGASWIRLEVRASNKLAINLYKKYTFKVTNSQRRFYPDNREDALHMWSDCVTTPEFKAKYTGLKRKLFETLARADIYLAGDPQPESYFVRRNPAGNPPLLSNHPYDSKPQDHKGV